MIMSDRQPMQRASDFDPEVMLVFDQYVHGDIDRRTFLERVGRLAVGTVTAAGLLGALSPRFAEAQQIAPTDERLEAGYVEYDSPKGHGRARGYLVRPAKASAPHHAALRPGSRRAGLGQDGRVFQPTVAWVAMSSLLSRRTAVHGMVLQA
jgi:hypothetical protein